MIQQETNTTPETKAVATTKAMLSFAMDENQGIRAVTLEDDSIWFVAKDVCEILDYRDAFNAVRMLDEDEKGTHQMSTLGGKQEVTIISEPGLYRMIMRSNKPEAKPFQKWVSHEVLPSIRKTGGYAMDKALVKDITQVAEQLAGLEQKLDQFQVNRIQADLESSPLKLFIQGRCTVRPDAIIMKKELYQAYEAYSMKHGIDPMNQPRFFLSLYKAIASVRSTKRSIGRTIIPCVSGIRLNRDVPRPAILV
jgi:prophage antirepressor-like protein